MNVITWYSTLIPAKLFRASLQALADDHTEIYDSNGSARVALSGIERSLSAFTVLIEQLPEYEMISLILWLCCQHCVPC